MTQTSFVFDVDGTLTPSSEEMNPEFRQFFTQYLMSRHKVYIVTGAEYSKTVQQLGKEICENVHEK